MKRASLWIIHIVLLSFILSNNIGASNQSGDLIVKDVADKISRAFLSGDVDLIGNFMLEGNRVYSDWEDVFSSKGYFGKGQIILSLQKFFKENEILGAQLPEEEKKLLGENKYLFKILMTYKNKLKDNVINQNIFFLLTKQSDAGNPANPAGWIISEIKKIN
jgi:hypothetical protein